MCGVVDVRFAPRRSGTRIRAQRARKRMLRPVPPPPPAEPVAAGQGDLAEIVGVAEDGPCVVAVRGALAALGDLPLYQAEAAAALAMALILDSPGCVTTMPSACRQLLVLMDVLRKSAGTRKGGRLARVQEMSEHRAVRD